MAINLGKKFEQQVKKDLERSFPNSFVLRLPDQQSGYQGTSQNICDFMMYTNGKLFLLECKSHKGNTFPLSNLTQFGKLQKYKDLPGIRCGVILWFIEHDKVFYVPISTFLLLAEEGKKSINIKDAEGTEYPMYELPSTKKKTFLETDYLELIFI